VYQVTGCLAGGSGDVGGDDAGGVPVQRGAGPVVAHRGAVSVGGGFLDVAQRDTGIQRGGNERVAQGVRPDGLGDSGPPGDTIRPAPCRSSRRPSGARKIGPSARSPVARSIARAVRGASGMVTTLLPLRVITRVRWPRSMPRPSAFAPVASKTRRPLRASREISACSAGGPSPAATRSAELVAVQSDRGAHGPSAVGKHGQPVSGRGALPRRPSGRTPSPCTGGE
jgi:hypothetical protein